MAAAREWHGARQVYFVAPRYAPDWLTVRGDSSVAYRALTRANRLLQVEFDPPAQNDGTWTEIFADNVGDSERALNDILTYMTDPSDARNYYARAARRDSWGKHTAEWMDLFTPLFNGSPIWWFDHGAPERPATLRDFHKYKQGSSLGKKHGSFYAMSYADFESGNWPKEVEKLGAWEETDHGGGDHTDRLDGGEPQGHGGDRDRGSEPALRDRLFHNSSAAEAEASGAMSSDAPKARARTAKENPADRIKTYWGDLSREEKDSLIAQRKRELAAIGALSFPIEATFSGEQVTVLGPVHLFPPYDDPAYGKPNLSSNAQLMTQGADGRKFITIASSVFVDGKPLLGRNPPMRDPLAPWEKHLLGIKEASEAATSASEATIPISDDQIAFMYREGMSIRNIAEAYGIGKDTVERSLRRTGTPRRGRGRGPASTYALTRAGISDDQIAFMYREGMSIRDIAGAYGLVTDSVKRSLQRTGTPRRTHHEAGRTPSVLAKIGSAGPKTERKIVDLYLSGPEQSMAAVAATLGVDQRTVKKTLARYDIVTRGRGEAGRKVTPEMEQRAIEMYQAGTSSLEISRAFGVGQATVRKILIKHNVPRRPVRLYGGGEDATAAESAADSDESAALICMGRHVIMELEDCDDVELPARWGMLHDPSGTFWPKCSLLFCKFSQGSESDSSDEGVGYFGKHADVCRGQTKMPLPDLHDGWREVGIVKQIFYERAGTKAPGRFKHKFNDPRGWMWLVALFKRRVAETPPVLFEYNQNGMRALRLELPDGCAVDDRGIALP